MIIKNLSIMSDSAELSDALDSPVCFVKGRDSDHILDLVRELIGNSPYCTPDIIDDGSYVLHADVLKDGKKYALCYLRNADYVGDCRIAANFEPYSTKFSVDDTEEYLDKTANNSDDWSNVLEYFDEAWQDSTMAESDRVLSTFIHFIARCEKNADDDRPIFIYGLFDRLDESIDINPYLNKLASLGRQVFIAVGANYPNIRYKGISMIEGEV